MSSSSLILKKTATLSPCRKYRYALWRSWNTWGMPYALFIGLNPSTADETNDDPTIRRCIRYARDWGYDGLCMVNLFACRATSPSIMKAAKDPVGPENDRILMEMARNAEVIIAAWGIHGSYLNRDQKVQKMIPRLHVLKLTKSGHPAHPLYLQKELKPVPFNILINSKGKKENKDEKYTLSEASSEMGRRGMKALQKKLTPEQRSEKARRAVQERWRLYHLKKRLERRKKERK